jgi:hypothetical protein
VRRLLTIAFLLVGVGPVVLAGAIGSKPVQGLPDRAMTPGAVDPLVTLADLCPVAHTARREVTTYQKNIVFAEYGIERDADGNRIGGPYKLDHLISLDLGGSNELRNLWPLSYSATPWDAHRKDVLENRLHAMVCAGAISLAVAQAAISADWTAAYRLYVGER